MIKFIYDGVASVTFIQLTMLESARILLILEERD